MYVQIGTIDLKSDSYVMGFPVAVVYYQQIKWFDVM